MAATEKKVDDSLEEKTTEEDADDLESVNSSEALKSVRSMVMEAIAIVQVWFVSSIRPSLLVNEQEK